MTDFNDIDNLFREHQKDWEKSPNNKTWEDLTNRLDSKSLQQTSSKKTIVRWVGAACIVGILGICMYVFNKTTSNQSGFAAADKVTLPTPKDDINVRSLENEYVDEIEYRVQTSESLKTRARNESKTENSLTNDLEGTSKNNGKISSDFSNSFGENLKSNDVSTGAGDSYSSDDKIQQFISEESNNSPIAANLDEYELEEEFLEEDLNIGGNALSDSLLLENAYFSETTVLANVLNAKKEKEEHQAADSKSVDNLYFSQTTVQGNQIGNEYKKEEHIAAANKTKRNAKQKQEMKSSDEDIFDEKKVILPTHTRASEANFNYDQAQHLEQKEKLDGSYDYYSKDVLEEYYSRLNKIVTIKIPSFNTGCDTLYIRLSETDYNVTKCEQTFKGYLFENNFLSKFYELKVNELKSMEYKSSDILCTDDQLNKEMLIIIEYGQPDNRFTETIPWNLNCPKYEEGIYIKKFSKLIEQLEKSKN